MTLNKSALVGIIKMLKLEYHPEGALCNDFNVMEFAEMLWNSTKVGPQHIKVGNWLIIEASRVLITEGIIPHDQLLVVYNGNVMEVNKYAAYKDFNRDIPSHSLDFSETIVKYGINVRKQERKNK